MNSFVRIMLLLILIFPQNVRGRQAFYVIDMNNGLAESRIRDICQLPDGRIAFATAGMLTLYDGSHFCHFSLSPSDAVPLTDYKGYRKLYSDSLGRLWLKNNGRLFILNLQNGLCIHNEDSIYGTFGNVVNVGMDSNGISWFISGDATLWVMKHRIASLKQLQLTTPEHVEIAQGRAFLCYESGRVCAIDLKSGALVFNGNSLCKAQSDSLWTGINAIVKDSILWLANNYRYKEVSLLSRLNINSFEWQQTITIPQKVNDMALRGDSLWIVGSQGIFSYDENGTFISWQKSLPINGEKNDITGALTSILYDKYGGMWIGSVESGLLYSNSMRKSLIQTSNCIYPHELNGVFCSKRAEMIGKRYADGATNCSAEDNDGYVYLGTRNGLVIIDDKDKLITTLDERDGLSLSNVQAVMVASDGDIWITTPRGISKIIKKEQNSFCIYNYNEFDGIRLGGREFRLQEIFQDSAGIIHAGFVGGVCSFSPAAMDTLDRYVFNFPRIKEIQQKEDSGNVVLYVIIACICIVASFIIMFRIRSRHKKIEAEVPVETDMQSNNREYLLQAGRSAYNDIVSPDEEFLIKLRQVVEEHVADEDLTVQKLSELMAMERTGLYRRMQQLTGMSPSAYIKEVRMAIAAKLLRETNIPISDIAYRTGFSSSRYFNKVFKVTFSISSSDYRKG